MSLIRSWHSLWWFIAGSPSPGVHPAIWRLRRYGRISLICPSIPSVDFVSAYGRILVLRHANAIECHSLVTDLWTPSSTSLRLPIVCQLSGTAMRSWNDGPRTFGSPFCLVRDGSQKEHWRDMCCIRRVQFVMVLLCGLLHQSPQMISTLKHFDECKNLAITVFWQQLDCRID